MREGFNNQPSLLRKAKKNICSCGFTLWYS